MKKGLKLLFAGVVTAALCAGFAACNDAAGTQGEYVPFTEYSLEGGVHGEEFSAEWVNIDYGDDVSYGDKYLIINSDEELKKYVEGDYPFIDFSKKSLVLVYGCTHQTLHHVDVDRLSRMSGGKWQLNITIFLFETMSGSPWLAAMVIDKIETDSKFVINVKVPGSWPE